MLNAQNSISPRPGLIFVICAPSGTGKTTLARRLLGEFPNLGYSVSCTTRPPRQGEINGKDYHFMSKAEFISVRDSGKNAEGQNGHSNFIEWAQVHGNFYGTLHSTVKESLNAGQDLLFDIDVQGAAQMRLNFTGSLALAFIAPPSLAALESRLRNRGTDEDATIARRLANAKAELANAHWFDYIIVNDNLEQAYSQLRSAYLAASLSPRQQAAVLNNLFKQANQYV